jgi:hypothetical protein
MVVGITTPQRSSRLLNFDAADKLSREELIEIASGYIDKIGFGEESYLQSVFQSLVKFSESICGKSGHLLHHYRTISVLKRI